MTLILLVYAKLIQGNSLINFGYHPLEHYFLNEEMHDVLNEDEHVFEEEFVCKSFVENREEENKAILIDPIFNKILNK